MKVDFAHVTDIEKRLTVVVPPETVEERITKAYGDLKKTVHLKGFRPGKAPLPLLERYFKAQIEEEVVAQIVRDTYPKAVEEVHARPISQPKIENGVLERGKEFSYTAVFEIKPDIAVKDYSDIELPADAEIAVGDDEVGRELEQLRHTFATLREVSDRGIRKGDYAVLDIDGTVAGTEIKAGRQKDFFIEVDDNVYLPGFADHILGLSPGSTKMFNLTVPDDFSQKELAGKTVDVTVTVKTLKEKVLPLLDDEFAKDVGQYEGLEDLKQQLRAQLLARKKSEAEQTIREKIFDTLIQRNPLDVPRSLVEAQIQEMLAQTGRMLAAQGLKLSDIGRSQGELVERYWAPAERRVKAALLLEAVARQEGITVEDREIEEEYRRLAESVKQDVAAVKAKIEPDMLRPDILEKKTIDFIMAKAKRTET